MATQTTTTDELLGTTTLTADYAERFFDGLDYAMDSYDARTARTAEKLRTHLINTPTETTEVTDAENNTYTVELHRVELTDTDLTPEEVREMVRAIAEDVLLKSDSRDARKAAYEALNGDDPLLSKTAQALREADYWTTEGFCTLEME